MLPQVPPSRTGAAGPGAAEGVRAVTHVEDILLWAVAQHGDRYVFGAEVPLVADDAGAWDCSELVEWSCGKAGVQPTVLDGAFNQWSQIKKAVRLVPVKEGLGTRGALLFVGDGVGVGRDAITHVAFSLGDGTTVEARGKKWGVGCWSGAGRFDFAGLICGVEYDGSRQPLGPVPGPQVPPFGGLVKLGSTGDVVKLVQQRLKDRGWHLAVTGSFDDVTDKVVRAFQAEKGLVEDGKVGTNTWRALWLAPIT
jgi:cell wall-associated NlpC family hydrolase